LNLCWAVFIAYWLWSARNIKRNAQREPLWLRVLAYWLPLMIAVLLLGPGEWFGHMLIRENFVPHSNLVGIMGVGFAIVGVALACWSRHILGRNWSSVVVVKEDHELIQRGPYRYVRHPIYTGLLMLFFGNALIVGDWRGLIAVAIVFVSFWRKLRLEEQWLAAHFGQSYVKYVKETKALLPWVW
jgi:protein-S-isoprenylcysteine O-methyltransferase Ste14